ncbi:hypothetical protein C0995_004068 [Termitomyces sp. Mi166|nr:hypothetical protein C0995_004068 [Termitomyces sp. Mi166\
MRFCSVSFLLATSLAAVAAVTVNDCKKDVRDIVPHVQDLDNFVANLPKDSISLSQGIATPPFSATDSQAILKLVESYSPNFLRLLANVVAKKESIVRLPVPDVAAYVRGALDSLHRSNDAFDDAWISSSTVGRYLVLDI